MMRFARLRIAALAAVCLAAASLSPALAADSFQSILQGDVSTIEAKLSLSGDQAKQVDDILHDGVQQRLAVLTKLGVVYGKKPGFTTLLQLQSQMDDIRTNEQKQLSKILSESQMYTVEQLGNAAEQNFRAVILS